MIILSSQNPLRGLEKLCSPRRWIYEMTRFSAMTPYCLYRVAACIPRNNYNGPGSYSCSTHLDLSAVPFPQSALSSHHELNINPLEPRHEVGLTLGPSFTQQAFELGPGMASLEIRMDLSPELVVVGHGQSSGSCPLAPSQFSCLYSYSNEYFSDVTHSIDNIISLSLYIFKINCLVRLSPGTPQ